MEYRAVGNRCAVNLASLRLPIADSEALAILTSKGFRIVEIDLITTARQCIKNSHYRRGAKASQAPAVVDCSSFVKWLYGQRGIWLPRRTIQQKDIGETILLKDTIENDLVFVSGCNEDYYEHNPQNGVGHVGIVTSKRTIIHATHKVGVVEDSLNNMLGNRNLCGIRRYVPQHTRILTLETPANHEIETADDIRWVVLQSLPKKK